MIIQNNCTAQTVDVLYIIYCYCQCSDPKMGVWIAVAFVLNYSPDTTARVIYSKSKVLSEWN